MIFAAVGAADNEDIMRGAFISSIKVANVGDFVPSESGKLAEERIWVCDFMLVLSLVSFGFVFRTKLWRYSVALIPRWRKSGLRT